MKREWTEKVGWSDILPQPPLKGPPLSKFMPSPFAKGNPDGEAKEGPCERVPARYMKYIDLFKDGI